MSGRTLWWVEIERTSRDGQFIDTPDDWTPQQVAEFAEEDVAPELDFLEDDFSCFAYEGDGGQVAHHSVVIANPPDGMDDCVTDGDWKDWRAALRVELDPKAPTPGQLDVFGNEVKT